MRVPKLSGHRVVRDSHASSSFDGTGVLLVKCPSTRVALDGTCVASALVGYHVAAKVGWMQLTQKRL
jgi:hypothetical protein